MSPGLKFLQVQCRRVAFGLTLGSLIAMAVHLLNRDSAFASILRQRWVGLSIHKYFDGLSAYKPEATILCVGVLALAAVPAFTWSRRYIRAWWAGITSFITLAATLATVAALKYRPTDPVAIALGLTALVALLLVEYWRLRPKPSRSSTRQLRLSIPITKGNESVEQQWLPSRSDDPISEWHEDIVGRIAVVELLFDYALRLRTPIVALKGGLGDGKSSVLNLLRRAVEGQAIVVSFIGWLPGSEATLAADLFRDIATECRKYVCVPQLRKRALSYARTISSSVSYLAGLKELFPAQSQREDIEELWESLSRVPLPILVLLDEVDRMHKDELLVLLKILRGASSIPNVTFVCAFSQEAVLKELAKDSGYLEKLEKCFPVSVHLSAPDPDMLGRLFQTRLKKSFEEQKWFKTEENATTFAELLERTWNDSLYKVCTNIRKVTLLLNDIFTASRQVVNEVNPFDLVIVEAIRRFYPQIHELVRVNPLHLTYERGGWPKGEYLPQEEKKKRSDEYFKVLNNKISESNEPTVLPALLSWLFPAYAATGGRTLFYQHVRPTNEEMSEDQRRICNADYFPIYFRAAVPEEMFSNAELERIVSDLNEAKTDEEVRAVFSRLLDSIPRKHPKREDFLWKLGRASDRLNDVTAKRLAYAAAERASDYAYDIVNVGEAARALNIVFHAAQKLSTIPGAQQVLEGAMARASDDTFAREIWEFTEHKDRNKVLTNFSNVDVAGIKRVFMERMRQRYGPTIEAQEVNIAQGEWHAFRLWVDNSDEDRTMEQDFWRRFIGRSRKRLAQAINFVYPGGGTVWSDDPTPIVDSMFPTAEFKRLLDELPEDQGLDEIEQEAIARLRKLFQGGFRKVGQFEV